VNQKYQTAILKFESKLKDLGLSDEQIDDLMGNETLPEEDLHEPERF